MRPDYLDNMKSNRTSLLDWSLQNSKKEPPFQIKNDQWELLEGEIDVAAQSPKPQHVVVASSTSTTPVQRPRRHRCISDDTQEEPQHDCHEREFFDLKPKSLSACFDTDEFLSLGERLPILSFDEPSTTSTSHRSKRSRDCCDSELYPEDDQVCCERQPQPPLRKRRRVAGRNNALCAQDYNEIFSQIGC